MRCGGGLRGEHPRWEADIPGAPTYPYMLPEKEPGGCPLRGPLPGALREDPEPGIPTAVRLLPALNLAQEIRGHVSPGDHGREVARLLGLSDAYVRGVATFYTMYNKRPVGRFLIQVCTNISCNLCGGDEVLAAFLEATGPRWARPPKTGSSP
jgi:hypothetical protein